MILEAELTKKELSEEYWKLYRKLGKFPRSSHMPSKGQMSIYHYFKAFGSWKKFTTSKEFRAARPVDAVAPDKKKILTELFKKRMQELGRQPVSMDFMRGGYTQYAGFIKHFGSWEKFLKTVGLKPYRREFPSRAVVIPVEELDKNFDAVKKKLGRIPAYLELLKHGKYSLNRYRRAFGGYKNYLDRRGLKYVGSDTYRTKEEYINEYRRLRKQLGRQPRLLDIKRYSPNWSPVFCSQLFGGYRGLLKAAGEKTHLEKVADEFFRLKSKLGRNPTGTEFAELSDYYASSVLPVFSNWNDFVRSLGEKPYKRGGGSHLNHIKKSPNKSKKTKKAKRRS